MEAQQVDVLFETETQARHGGSAGGTEGRDPSKRRRAYLYSRSIFRAEEQLPAPVEQAVELGKGALDARDGLGCEWRRASVQCRQSECHKKARADHQQENIYPCPC